MAIVLAAVAIGGGGCARILGAEFDDLVRVRPEGGVADGGTDARVYRDSMPDETRLSDTRRPDPDAADAKPKGRRDASLDGPLIVKDASGDELLDAADAGIDSDNGEEEEASRPAAVDARSDPGSDDGGAEGSVPVDADSDGIGLLADAGYTDADAGTLAEDVCGTEADTEAAVREDSAIDAETAEDAPIDASDARGAYDVCVDAVTGADVAVAGDAEIDAAVARDADEIDAGFSPKDAMADADTASESEAFDAEIRDVLDSGFPDGAGASVSLIGDFVGGVANGNTSGEIQIRGQIQWNCVVRATRSDGLTIEGSLQ